MAKNDWARLVEEDDIPGLSVVPSPGHGWRSFAALVVVVGATFVVAYYVPLHRAYASLFHEYQSLSAEASRLHQQLGDAVATLNLMAKPCASTREGRQAEGRDAEALLSRAERLERGLLLALRKYQGSAGISIERNAEKLRVTLASPAFVEQAESNLTDLGKKAVCVIGGELRDSDVHVLISGLGVLPKESRRTTWQLASARAGSVAQHLSTNCGVDALRIQVAVNATREIADQSAVTLEITPNS